MSNRNIIMKKYIFITAILATLFLVSCDDLKDTVEVGIRTNIEADIPVISQKIVASDTNSENNLYGFLGGGVFSIADVPELKKYINNITGITAEKGSIVRFNGASDGNKVLSLRLRFGIQTTPGEEPAMTTAFDFSGELVAQNGVIEFLDDTWAPVLISTLDSNMDKVFVLIVEGTANYNVNSTVKVKVPVKVSSKPLQNN